MVSFIASVGRFGALPWAHLKKFGQKELQHVFSSYVVRLRVKYYVVNIFCFGFVGDLV